MRAAKRKQSHKHNGSISGIVSVASLTNNRRQGMYVDQWGLPEPTGNNLHGASGDETNDVAAFHSLMNPY